MQAFALGGGPLGAYAMALAAEPTTTPPAYGSRFPFPMPKNRHTMPPVRAVVRLLAEVGAPQVVNAGAPVADTLRPVGTATPGVLMLRMTLADWGALGSLLLAGDAEGAGAVWLLLNAEKGR